MKIIRSFTKDAFRMISIMEPVYFMIKEINHNTKAVLKMAKNLDKVHFKAKVFIIMVNGLITFTMAKDH